MKKQILKTSVLAAVLLSMGAAHADNIGDSASMVVSGSVGAPTCTVKIDKPSIELGHAIPGDFVTTGTLVKPQNFTISLVGCTSEMDTTDKMKRNVDLKITGPLTASGDGYFGTAGTNSLAVGLVEKNETTLLENNKQVALVDKGGALTGVKKEFTVGLVAKDPKSVKAGESVSVPLTFQLVTR
ncbi:fimbrial protein [Photorhabdus sp. P32]|uniref:fimbrial protein n=1 Tax=Photorhabdus sp. P32 TaxID=3117549 RepID=UPI00311B2F40